MTEMKSGLNSWNWWRWHRYMLPA